MKCPLTYRPCYRLQRGLERNGRRGIFWWDTQHGTNDNHMVYLLHSIVGLHWLHVCSFLVHSCCRCRVPAGALFGGLSKLKRLAFFAKFWVRIRSIWTHTVLSRVWISNHQFGFWIANVATAAQALSRINFFFGYFPVMERYSWTEVSLNTNVKEELTSLARAVLARKANFQEEISVNFFISSSRSFDPSPQCKLWIAYVPKT